MSIPRGLRTPGRIAALIPPLLVLVGIIAAVGYAAPRLVRQADNPPPMQGATPQAGAGVTGSLFQPELLWAFGILVLFLVLAYGVWRTQLRGPRHDALRDRATRNLYDEPRR